MGVHIILYRRKGHDSGDSFNIERNDDFDSMRHSGDKEFALGVLFKFSIEHNEEIYYRPSDFKQAIGWVEENVAEGNKKRLLDLLHLMENDENLILYFSY